jgi:DtxR family transcriptional regulator, Mn-dependent transcriptional regulator
MAAPSQTVENYLKAIYQVQAAGHDPEAMVPMGRIATALGVVPGTATTMVKALADSGLVEYEPYVGVKLTRAGEKLAALVLRRHRLVELFLVQVMGMSWAEVHDEAEQLEHAVSDRLIERMDEMLGRPERDPHGDPIPDAEGQLTTPQEDTLLTCPLHVPIRVTQVADQGPAFLRFVEQHHLKPGAIVEVDARDAAADQVNLKRNDERVTLGTRAAAKLRVSVLAVLALLFAAPLLAQQALPEPSLDPARKFEIQDNSFLVEEAFNQERGIYQNIFGFTRDRAEWQLAFTQEWPIGEQTHQVSYTIPFGGYSEANGLGDAMLNYRYQVTTEGASRPAFSPRVSLILPTGGSRRGHDTLGYQLNLPLSKQLRDWYLHWNAGFTSYPGVPGSEGEDVSLFTPHLAASAIWRARPMVHLMMETVFESQEEIDGRHSRFTASPGVRAGRNSGDAQIVVGAALPVTFSGEDTEAAILLYLSYELPFRR